MKTAVSSQQSAVSYCFPVVGMVLGILAFFVSTLSADTLTLTDGEVMEGTILERTADGIQVEITRGGGRAQLEMPLERVERVEFSGPETAPVNLEAWKRLWEARKPFLDIPGSDAGTQGLGYVKALLATGDPERARDALAITELVREEAWDAGQRSSATQMRLSALAAAGSVEQALQEAQSLETMGVAETADLARTRVRSRFVQAEVAWKAVEDLETDWPKWDLMPEKRAERRKLINEALDQFLFPVAHHAELKDLCAEGLWQAASIYARLGRLEESRLRAREIIDHFPEPAYVEQARELLNNQPNQEERNDA